MTRSGHHPQRVLRSASSAPEARTILAGWRAHPDIPGLAGWRPLARGGFATVWEAKQESLNRLVAVKVDQRTLDTEPEQRRFLREAGAAGRMSGYPGIVTVHDAGDPVRQPPVPRDAALHRRAR